MAIVRFAALFVLLAWTAAPQSDGQSGPQAQDASNLQKHLEEARKGAEQGDAKCEAFLAFYYLWGIGVKKDEAEAAKWYRRSAEQGNAQAQSVLGGMYTRGEGVPQKYAEAVLWYRKAAEQGGAVVQADLAEMYEHGKGVPQDYSEAVRWYRKAAEQGWPAAQFQLGLLYFRGQGETQDYVEAHMWMNLAASRVSGDLQGEVASYRDLIAAKMTAQQIAEAQRLASEWKPIDAKASKAPAQQNQ